jgi:hemoglobin/transferrin/lactoferrin receptor protein
MPPRKSQLALALSALGALLPAYVQAQPANPPAPGASAPATPAAAAPAAAASAAEAAPQPAAPASAAPAPVQPAPAADGVTRLREITITSTRTERALDQVPNTVTVRRQPQIEASGARDLKDLLRNEADVAVLAGPARFNTALSGTGRAGNQSINIRGLEGNQVLLMVDGIRVPNAFSFGGAFTTGRADYFDVDALSTVEVLRGPASTQYGSDGLAGAVSLVTLSPDEVLTDGRTFAGFGRASVASVDRSTALTGAFANAWGPERQWKSLLLVTHRQGHELDNRGDNDEPNSRRTQPNPLDTKSDSLLAKLAWRMNAVHELGLTLESRDLELEHELLSARAPLPVAPPPAGNTATLDLDARDRVRRHRVSLEHRLDDLNAQWLQKARSHLYVQTAETRQFTAEDRNVSADRTRDNRYREELTGFSTQAQTQWSGTLNQRLSYGLDASRNEISGLRDGTVPPAGETFPVKPFPDTTYTLVGAFAQSEMELGDWTLIPALRYDAYKLEPSPEGFVADADNPVVTLSDRAFTPRLGALWRLSDAWVPYGQVALGFRAPTPEQVNNGFTNTTQFYRSIGNPDLKPEHASSIELGVRGGVPGWRWQVAAYDNRYRDFIFQQQVSGPPPGMGTVDDPTIFQYVNIASARIRGLEARAEWRPMPGWTVRAAAAKSKGDGTDADGKDPLDTILPARATLGIRHETGAWELGADFLHSEGKDIRYVDLSNVASTPFTPRSHDVLDLSAVWRVSPTLKLIANLNNVGDVKYWRWADVRGVAAGSTVLDGFTAPGRNLQLAMRADF